MSPDGTRIVLPFTGASTMPHTQEPKTYAKGVEEYTRWGHWIVTHDVKFAEDGRTPVEAQKDITVNAGASLSAQTHFGRGEIYIGIEGETIVGIGTRVTILKAGDEAIIPRGLPHWSASINGSKFHEIQHGPLCDELDIKRGADRYKQEHELNPNDVGIPPIEAMVQSMIRTAKDRFETEDMTADFHENDFMPMALELMEDYHGAFDDESFVDALHAQFEEIVCENIRLHAMHTPELKQPHLQSNWPQNN